MFSKIVLYIYYMSLQVYLFMSLQVYLFMSLQVYLLYVVASIFIYVIASERSERSNLKLIRNNPRSILFWGEEQ